MQKCFLILILNCFTLISCFADRIFIMNASGYNTAEPQLIAAITSNGHFITVESSAFSSLPAGFTTACIDPINGYDWLCFFGDYDFSPLLPQIQAFIDSGGKVFYQYEVSCCTTSATSAAAVISGLTGLAVTTNSNAYIALAGANTPGWEATNISCCATFKGNAYKGLDGIPAINQLQATATLNGASPLVSTCSNFGFKFTTTDFVGTANKGAVIGLGDINAWYDSGEPLSSGGPNPINPALIDYFFPGNASSCFFVPQGCLLNFNNQPLSIDFGNDTSLLCQGTLTLNAGAVGVYLWQDNSTNPTFTVTQQGTYWVKVTNNCGTASDTIIVSYNSTAAVNLGNDTSLCPGETLNLNAVFPGATYLWQDNSTNSTFTVIQSGTYWVKVTVNSCSKSDTIHIIYDPLSSFGLGNDTSLCQGSTLPLNASTINTTYLWQDNSTDSALTVTVAGTYWVNVTNNCGTISDTIVISYNPIPSVNLGNDTSLCVLQTLYLSALSQGASYLWQDNSTNSSFTVTQAGTFWVKVSKNSCINSDTISVTYGPTSAIKLGNDTTLCQGASLILNSSASAGVYLWQDNSTVPTFTVTQQGIYWVKVTNICGIISDTIKVSYNPISPIHLGDDTVLCLGETILIDASFPDAQYLWQDNYTNAVFTASQSGTYWVRVTNLCGSSSDTIIVEYENCNCTLFIPNTFTPNKNDLNDKFSPVFDCVFTEYHFMIFNRWGEKIFETNNPSESWDGMYKGMLSEIGVYVYVLKYQPEKEESKTVYGHVNLIR